MDDKGPTGTQQDVSPANLSFVDPLDLPSRRFALRHNLQGRPQFGQKQNKKEQKHCCPTQFQLPRQALRRNFESFRCRLSLGASSPEIDQLCVQLAKILGDFAHLNTSCP